MLYESIHTRPLSRTRFFLRFLRHFAIAVGVVLVSIGAGMLGYHHYEHLGWLDAFLNTSMLLGGMGPVDMPHTPGGKMFAGLYALYSGLIFLVVAGILMAPVVHRILHRFQWSRDRARARARGDDDSGDADLL
jgi:hypothetical protein